MLLCLSNSRRRQLHCGITAEGFNCAKEVEGNGGAAACLITGNSAGQGIKITREEWKCSNLEEHLELFSEDG